MNIGVIVDFDSNRQPHQANNNAIYHAANHLSTRVDIIWISTPLLLTPEDQQRPEQFDGLWAAPGIFYQSLNSVLRGIRFAQA